MTQRFSLIFFIIILLLLVAIDMGKGVVGDMDSLGVTESYLVKRQVLLSAAEAAEMILRVDDIIKAPPRYYRNRENRV